MGLLFVTDDNVMADNSLNTGKVSSAVNHAGPCIHNLLSWNLLNVTPLDS
jgi:hypothetical protein